MSLPAALVAKQQVVQNILREFPRVIVAFSGGVDSTLLAKLALDVLGREHVLTVTADSPSLARQDLHDAIHFASTLGLSHRVIPTRELENPLYRANSPGRCYICKQELFQELEELARAERFPAVLYGAIGDDQPQERAGQRAALERGVRAPLQEANLTKAEVRQLARSLGLPNWNRPQNACLSSRIPHGEQVSPERLALVEQAEAALKAEGFAQVRVRYHGRLARIEVGKEELTRLRDVTLSRRVIFAVRSCGFDEVEIDAEGYHRYTLKSS